MTDNEIKKALECHKFAYDPYMQSVIEQTLDLINRQKAEIERLNGYINTNCIDCAGCNQWKCDCANIKSKAIKEFAERLKREKRSLFDIENIDGLIDNLVKEMVGEDK